MKISLHGLNRRLESTQEKRYWISRSGDRNNTKNTQNEQSLSDLWDVIKQSNKYVIGVSEKVKRQGGAQKYVKGQWPRIFKIWFAI